MATAPDIQTCIAAHCVGEQGAFGVDLLELGTAGCTALGEASWDGEDDFVQLTIAGTIVINGRVTSHDGRLAQIRFYGQIHPAALAKVMAHA